MRRPTAVAQNEIPKDEQIAVDFEARRISSEAAFESASKGKKNIEADVANLSEIARSTEEIIRYNREKITVSARDLSVAEEATREEKRKGQSIAEDNKKASEELEMIRKRLSEEKAKIADDIQEMREGYNSARRNSESELATIASQKNILLVETKALEESITNLHRQEKEEQEKLEVKKKDNAAINEKAATDFASLERIGISITTGKKILSDRQTEIDQLDSHIASRKEKSASLDKEIQSKEELYRATESKAFILLKKEEMLNQREAFLKSNYERAGIKWTE